MAARRAVPDGLAEASYRVSPREEPQLATRSRRRSGAAVPLQTGKRTSPSRLPNIKILYAAVMRAVHVNDSQLARRCRRWLRDLIHGYRIRSVQNDPLQAERWLLQQLRTVRLPDLRPGKSLLNDVELLARFNQLRRKLAPLFATGSNAVARNRSAAPIVSRVLGHSVRPQDLPATAKLTEFCHAVLGTSGLQLSRAKRRLGGSAAGQIQDAIDVLSSQLPVLDRRDPGAAKRTRVLMLSLEKLREDLAGRRQRP